MRTWIGACTLVLAAAPAAAQKPEVIQKAVPDTAGPPEVFHGCPLEGVATVVHRQESNREKNRTTHPQAADIDSSATLPAIMEPGYDADRWSGGARRIDRRLRRRGQARLEGNRELRGHGSGVHGHTYRACCRLDQNQRGRAHNRGGDAALARVSSRAR